MMLACVDSWPRSQSFMPGFLQAVARTAMLGKLAVQIPLRHLLFRGVCMSQVRIIKKYPNRRLYDTEISSYVTLEDVRQLIVEGEGFEVRDAKTGKDLTRAVLLQILAEHEDIGQPIFSTQLLTTVIRFYGDSLQGIIGSYLERSIQVFSEQQQQLRGTIGNLVVQNPWALLNQLTERNMEIWKGLQQGIKSGLSAVTEKAEEEPKTEPRPRKRAARR
jgi:polyhydroxyalkanoate synthesis repressor PhaR